MNPVLLIILAIAVLANGQSVTVNPQITDAVKPVVVASGPINPHDVANKPLKGPHVAPLYVVQPTYDNGPVVATNSPKYGISPVYDNLDSDKVKPTGQVSTSAKSLTENATPKLYSSQNVVVEPTIPDAASKEVQEAKRLVGKVEQEVIESAQAVDGNMKPMARIEVKKEKEQLRRAARLVDIAESKGVAVSKKLKQKIQREAKAVHVVDSKTSKKKNKKNKKNKKKIGAVGGKKSKIKNLLKKVKKGVLKDAKQVDQKMKGPARADIPKEKQRLLKAASLIDAAKKAGKNVKKLTKKIIREAKAVHLVDKKSKKKSGKKKNKKNKKKGVKKNKKKKGVAGVVVSAGMKQAQKLINKIKTEITSTSKEVKAKLPVSAVKAETKKEQSQIVKAAKMLDNLKKKGKDVSAMKSQLVQEAKDLKALKKTNKKQKKDKKKKKKKKQQQQQQFP